MQKKIAQFERQSFFTTVRKEVNYIVCKRWLKVTPTFTKRL